MEILIGAIILYIVGMLLKKIDFIKDNFIPLILAGLGVVGFMFYHWSTPMDWNLIVMSGLNAASMSVLGNQLIKQLIVKLPLENSTKKAISDLVDKVEEEK